MNKRRFKKFSQIEKMIRRAFGRWNEHDDEVTPEPDDFLLWSFRTWNHERNEHINVYTVVLVFGKGKCDLEDWQMHKLLNEYM